MVRKGSLKASFVSRKLTPSIVDLIAYTCGITLYDITNLKTCSYYDRSIYWRFFCLFDITCEDFWNLVAAYENRSNSQQARLLECGLQNINHDNVLAFVKGIAEFWLPRTGACQIVIKSWENLKIILPNRLIESPNQMAKHKFSMSHQELKAEREAFIHFLEKS